MPVTPPDNYFLNLKDFGLLEVRGEDAGSFLQSQLTSDISTLDPGDAQFSSWCNPQGRIISTILLVAMDNAHFVLLPLQLLDELNRKLSMYILRSRVTITPFNTAAQIIGLAGEDVITGVNDHITGQDQLNDAFIFTVPGTTQERGILVAVEEVMKDLYAQFADIKILSTDTYWQYQDIVSGIVWTNKATTEKLLPQDIGLEKLGALSFNKGCFPGQEIIARLHYRGKEKYGLYRGSIMNAQHSPEPGDRLYSIDDANSIGMIVSLIKLDNEIHCLASLNHDKYQQSTFNVEKRYELNISFTEV